MGVVRAAEFEETDSRRHDPRRCLIPNQLVVKESQGSSQQPGDANRYCLGQLSLVALDSLAWRAIQPDEARATTLRHRVRESQACLRTDRRNLNEHPEGMCQI